MAAALSLAPSLLRAGEMARPQEDGTRQKKVLVVYSTRRDTQLPTVADRELPRLLEQGLGSRPDFYSEHLDAARFPEAQYQAAFRDYLRLKYKGTRFDVVLAVHRLAYEIVSSARDEVFPGTPVVFLARDRAVPRGANTAEIIAEADYRRTLTLATRLQPDTTRVFVVGGSSDRDAAMVRAARHQFATFGPPLDVHLSDESLDRGSGTAPGLAA